MINIVHILTDKNVGGAGVWLINYLKYFERGRLKVSVVLPRGSALKHMVEAVGITVHEMDNIETSFNRVAIKPLKELFKRLRPDVVHTHASLSARLAARRAHVKLVVNTRHCLEPPRNGFVYSFLNNMLSDRFIAISEAVKDNLVKSGIKPDKIELVYNGIQPLKEWFFDECSALKDELGLERDSVVISIFARMESVKGHRFFIDAARMALAEMQNLHFLIVGEGSMEHTLREYAGDLADSRITFTGFREDITGLMNITDINVCASLSEGLSLSILEGMSLKKPTISTDSGGTREIVTDGETGILVPIGAARQMAAAMIRLAQNQALREKMGFAARETLRARFTADKMCEKLEKIYNISKESAK